MKRIFIPMFLCISLAIVGAEKDTVKKKEPVQFSAEELAQAELIIQMILSEKGDVNFDELFSGSIEREPEKLPAADNTTHCGCIPGIKKTKG